VKSAFQHNKRSLMWEGWQFLSKLLVHVEVSAIKKFCILTAKQKWPLFLGCSQSELIGCINGEVLDVTGDFIWRNMLQDFIQTLIQRTAKGISCSVQIVFIAFAERHWTILNNLKRILSVSSYLRSSVSILLVPMYLYISISQGTFFCVLN